MTGNEGSRLTGFYRLAPEERRRAISAWLGEAPEALDDTFDKGGLDTEAADLLVENVMGTMALPFAVAPNFVVNGREVLMPMVIEEPSVVAAAANAARLVRSGGGFVVEASAPVMTGQIFLTGCDVRAVKRAVAKHRAEILSAAAAADPVLARLGGGPRDLEVRRLAPLGMEPEAAVMHLQVDVRDAMGANVVNTMAERISPLLEKLTGGRSRLRILTNLCRHRTVRATCRVPLPELDVPGFSPIEVRDGVVAVSALAERDVFRAVTHNKGIMNGIDAVLLATGNDWRAAEAGAHAWAVRGGRYRPLCTWRADGVGDLTGRLELPLAAGTVGGSTSVHPVAALARRLLRADTAGQLVEAAAAAGMANNLAALRALATEGIQAGHMRLHARCRQRGKNWRGAAP